MSEYKLPAIIASPQDLGSLILEIREYAKWFSHISVMKQVKAQHVPEAPLLTPAASQLIEALGTQKPLSDERLEALIKSFETMKQSAPQVTITLAAPAPPAVKARLVEWVRTNLAPNALVTLQFNSTLLGGMVVRCGSHIFDWSFRKTLLADRSKFVEVLGRV